jgi:hypothetical protein
MCKTLAGVGFQRKIGRTSNVKSDPIYNGIRVFIPINLVEFYPETMDWEPRSGGETVGGGAGRARMRPWDGCGTVEISRGNLQVRLRRRRRSGY